MKFCGILITFLYLVNCEDYCHICKNHIGCKNDGRLGENCEKTARLVDLDDEINIKDFFVEEHNKIRNNVALGKLKPLQSAVRMPTMAWDDELAQLAELNVKTCKFLPDDCHDTSMFYYSGQNLARWSGFPAIDPIKAADKAVISWFEEYKNLDLSIISQYRTREKTVGHFTVMISERNTKLGCAMLKTVKGPYTTYSITCNYAATSIIGEPVYRIGKPTSECKTGKNPLYPGLCSTNELIDPKANHFIENLQII